MQQGDSVLGPGAEENRALSQGCAGGWLDGWQDKTGRPADTGLPGLWEPGLGWTVSLQVGVWGSLAGALGQEDRVMVASGQAWWLLARALQGLRGHIRAPGCITGTREGAGALLWAPRQAAQGLAVLPCPSQPRSCPAAGRSGHSPGSRLPKAECLDHPASSHSPAGPLLFSFGGSELIPAAGGC